MKTLNRLKANYAVKHLTSIGAHLVRFFLSFSSMAIAQSAPPPEAPSGFPQIRDAVDPKQDTQPARVNSINFYGNTKIATRELLQGIGISVGEVMRRELMRKAMESIVAEYRAIGSGVQVHPRVSHPKQNSVDVNFLIDEKGGTAGHH